ncbi:MAG: hypothetical protein NTY68_01155 [Candidatus Micrarchaeota archaeon]|nr:hypothetical protein [Candidatus Micrarchaeota archaeon]
MASIFMVSSLLLFKNKEKNGRQIQKELAQLKDLPEEGRSKIICIGDRSKRYFLRTFSEGVKIKAAKNDHGYSFYYSLDGIRLAGMTVECTCWPNLWTFRDSTCAISYITPQGKRRFVSEMWEIRAAARQLGLELLLN